MGCSLGCGQDQIKAGTQQEPSVPDDVVEDTSESDVNETVDSGGDFSISPSVIGTIRGVASQTQDGYCEKIFECCTSGEISQLGFESESVEECKEQDFRVAFSGLLSKYMRALERGTVQYNDDAAEACKQALAQRSCNEFSLSEGMFSEDRAGCSDIFEPLLENGDDCERDLECQSGLCKGGATTEQGECVEPPEAGGTCEDGRCTGNLYCDTSMGPLPEDWECKEKEPVGASCMNARTCASGRCEQQQNSGMQCVEKKDRRFCTGTENGEEGE
jgi:hypothetical protein